jgi:lysophospholipase L1-like esterase
MKTFLCLCLFLLLAACGGGGPDTPKAKTVISFYGDSITSGGQVAKIVRGDFIGLDCSVGGQHSDVPLNPADTASVVVIRYGMADAAHGLAPAQTRANVEKLLVDVKALGKRPIVVNVSYTPSGIELPVNAALQNLVDIDVSDLRGLLLDAYHPDEAFYALLNDRIHAELVRLLGAR